MSKDFWEATIKLMDSSLGLCWIVISDTSAMEIQGNFTEASPAICLSSRAERGTGFGFCWLLVFAGELWLADNLGHYRLCMSEHLASLWN